MGKRQGIYESFLVDLQTKKERLLKLSNFYWFEKALKRACSLWKALRGFKWKLSSFLIDKPLKSFVVLQTKVLKAFQMYFQLNLEAFKAFKIKKNIVDLEALSIIS